MRRGAALLVVTALGAVTLGSRSSPSPVAAPVLPQAAHAPEWRSAERANEAPSIEISSDAPEEPVRWSWYDGRLVRAARTIEMRVTGYSPDERSCAPFADGVTASGYSVWTNGMKLAAADTGVLPFGTLISIPGYDDDRVVPVLDRGGRIKGRRLDVLFPTHRAARRWGVQNLTVTVWEEFDD